MIYSDFKDEGTNNAKIAGEVASLPKISHEIDGEKFYEFAVKVKRLSGAFDFVPVTISERTFMGSTLEVDDFVELLGEFRSYNRLQEEKSRLILTFFAKELKLSEEREYVNEIKLLGFICKEPIYRKTPFEREICDVLLAVNRPNYHKSDYIPCILWGRNARFIASQTVGAKVEISGRIQSREYTKKLPDETEQVRTAYEVSCQSVVLLGNVSSMPTNSKSESGSDAVNG